MKNYVTLKLLGFKPINTSFEILYKEFGNAPSEILKIIDPHLQPLFEDSMVKKILQRDIACNILNTMVCNGVSVVHFRLHIVSVKFIQGTFLFTAKRPDKENEHCFYKTEFPKHIKIDWSS